MAASGSGRPDCVDLLAATEKLLAPVIVRVQAGRLAGAGPIGVEVGKVISKYKTAKHFAVTITDDSLTITRKHEQIDAEAALDGFYVLRTPVPADELDAPGVVTAYKNLKYVERPQRRRRARRRRSRRIRLRRAGACRAGDRGLNGHCGRCAAARGAHALQMISGSAYQAGLAWLRAAAAVETGPVVDTLDLLVLRNGTPPAGDGLVR